MGTLHTLAAVAGEFVRRGAGPGQGVTIELTPAADAGNRARGAARYTAALVAPWLTAHKLRFVTARGYLCTYQYRDIAIWATKNLPGIASKFTVSMDDASTLPAKWTQGRIAGQARRIAAINGQALKDGAMLKAKAVKDWAESQRKADTLAAARAMSEAAALLDVLNIGAPWPDPGLVEPPTTPGGGTGGGGAGGGGAPVQILGADFTKPGTLGDWTLSDDRTADPIEVAGGVTVSGVGQGLFYFGITGGKLSQRITVVATLPEGFGSGGSGNVNVWFSMDIGMVLRQDYGAPQAQLRVGNDGTTLDLSGKLPSAGDPVTMVLTYHDGAPSTFECLGVADSGQWSRFSDGNGQLQIGVNSGFTVKSVKVENIN